MSQTIVLTIDGQEVRLAAGSITANDAKDFRAKVGVPLMQVLRDTDSIDLDVVAGLVWLARRRVERGLTYEAVAQSINYDTDLNFGSANGQVEAGNPET